jgi:[ribosomal protein S5]-alanine N-acetyltransferase
MNDALATPRLQLEPIVPAHADVLFEGLSAPALYEYIDQPPPASREALAQRFERWQSRRSPDASEGWLNWAVADRATHAYLGHVQATVMPDGKAIVAYILFPPARGRGLATEAVSAMIGHLRRHGIATFTASTDLRNTRSIALLERLGFARTGVAGGDAFYERRYEAA